MEGLRTSPALVRWRIGPDFIYRPEVLPASWVTDAAVGLDGSIVAAVGARTIEIERYAPGSALSRVVSQGSYVQGLSSERSLAVEIVEYEPCGLLLAPAKARLIEAEPSNDAWVGATFELPPKGLSKRCAFVQKLYEAPLGDLHAWLSGLEAPEEAQPILDELLGFNFEDPGADTFYSDALLMLSGGFDSPMLEATPQQVFVAYKHHLLRVERSTGRIIEERDLVETITGLRASDDGSTLVTFTSSVAKVWRTDPLRFVTHTPGSQYSLKISPEGRFLGYAQGTKWIVWDLDQDGEACAIAGGQEYHTIDFASENDVLEGSNAGLVLRKIGRKCEAVDREPTWFHRIERDPRRNRVAVLGDREVHFVEIENDELIVKARRDVWGRCCLAWRFASTGELEVLVTPAEDYEMWQTIDDPELAPAQGEPDELLARIRKKTGL